MLWKCKWNLQKNISPFYLSCKGDESNPFFPKCPTPINIIDVGREHSVLLWSIINKQCFDSSSERANVCAKISLILDLQTQNFITQLTLMLSGTLTNGQESVK